MQLDELTENQLKRIHKNCIRSSIEICRVFDKESNDYKRLCESIKMRFFDKKYFKRGYSYNPKTKKYKWVFGKNY